MCSVLKNVLWSNVKVTADFFENQLYAFQTFTETAECLVLKTKLVKDRMDIYTSASTYVCFMHLWSLLKLQWFTDAHACIEDFCSWTCMHIQITSSFEKWSSSVQCDISGTTIFLVSFSLMNNENKACLKHAECLILLQQDDNEDGTNFIHIFVVAYNLLWCHPKVSFYQIQWNTHFFGEWSFLNHSRSLNQDSKDVTLYYFNT